MFTGIIEGMGIVRAVFGAPDGKRLDIESPFALERVKVGDSIAVNGACLTAVKISGRRFSADVSPETLDMTTLGQVKTGDKVNLERALRLSDRLDGHLVSGHVDGTGRLEKRSPRGNAEIISFAVDTGLSGRMIPKGSVAVDGVSLTLNTVFPGGFSVAVIPHTAKMTTLSAKRPGDPVNIETDMIGKYVEQYISRRFEDADRPESKMSLSFLAKNGFM